MFVLQALSLAGLSLQPQINPFLNSGISHQRRPWFLVWSGKPGSWFNQLFFVMDLVNEGAEEAFPYRKVTP